MFRVRVKVRVRVRVRVTVMVNVRVTVMVGVRVSIMVCFIFSYGVILQKGMVFNFTQYRWVYLAGGGILQKSVVFNFTFPPPYFYGVNVYI